MVVRYAENSVVAQYDKQAVGFMQEVAKWERQADTAVSPQLKKKYREKARKLRQKAVDSLEMAKIAAAKRRYRKVVAPRVESN